MASPTAQRIELEAECRRCGASWQCTTWADKAPKDWRPFFGNCPACVGLSEERS